MRGDLLAPILQQCEEISQYRRARRAVEDVDPDTGEIEPDAPTGEILEDSGS